MQKLRSDLEEIRIPRERIIGTEHQDKSLEIPICAKDGLYLIPIATSNGQQFANTFAEVWASIPETDKQSILDHWLTNQWLRSVGPYNPCIKLLAQTRNLDGIKNWSSIATTNRNGHQITFEGAIMEHMPDMIVETLIAHELAVVKMLAAHAESSMLIQDYEFGEIMNEWGYQLDAFRTWFGDNHCNMDGWLEEASSSNNKERGMKN